MLSGTAEAVRVSLPLLCRVGLSRGILPLSPHGLCSSVCGPLFQGLPFPCVLCCLLSQAADVYWTPTMCQTVFWVLELQV